MRVDDATPGEPDASDDDGRGPAGEGEQAAHTADRSATDEEAAAAERAAAGVDLDDIGKHEREMAERGAEVKGEGAID